MSNINNMCEPGKKYHGEAIVTKLYDGTIISIPYTVINGIKKGPVLLVTSGHSGLSYNSIEASRKLIKIDPASIQGRLIIIPILNKLGFITKDERFYDLLNSFPGKSNGSLSERIAYIVTKDFISKSDYYIHLTNTPYGSSRINQVVMYPCPELLLEKEIELATAFGTPYISDSHNKLNDRLDKRPMTIACSKGIPGVMANVGENNNIDKNAIKCHYNGVLNVMKYYDMIEGVPEKPQGYIPWDRHVLPRSETGGFIKLLVGLGEKVKTGQILAEISNEFYDKKEVILSEVDGLVTIVPTIPIVNCGELIGLRISIPYSYSASPEELYKLSKDRPSVP